MKKLKLLLIGIVWLTTVNTQAQLNVNVNLSTPPVWAPADHVEAQYYYLPDIDSYYDVPSARFIYLRNGKWFRSASLPNRYRNYNLRGGQVIYLTDYRGNSPYLYHTKHLEKYHKNKVFKPKKLDNDTNENHGNNGNSGGHKKGKKDKR